MVDITDCFGHCSHPRKKCNTCGVKIECQQITEMRIEKNPPKFIAVGVASLIKYAKEGEANIQNKSFQPNDK